MKTNKHHRNKNLFDGWSTVHLTIGILMGWLMAPFFALLIMTLWEPFEIFVLSPLLRRFGINFGYESIQNSLSDILFNTVGVTLGAFVLGAMVAPPLHLF